MDPNQDPNNGRASGNQPGGDGTAGDTGRNAGGGAGAKPPPWQVPKPELRPDLLNEPVTPVDPFARDRERQLNETAAKKKRSQRRTVVVGLGVTALLAGTITAVVASNQDDPEYAQVCFNDETGERVEDTKCNSSAGRSGGIYAWYFFSRGAFVPAVGQNRSTDPPTPRPCPAGQKPPPGTAPRAAPSAAAASVPPRRAAQAAAAAKWGAEREEAVV